MSTHVSVENVNVFYNKAKALNDVSINIPKNSVYAFIGPSGCGKTTLLRSINRLNDLVNGFSLSGRICINGRNIYDLPKGKPVENLRRGIGMVFQQPNPLPMTIMQNMLLPAREHFKDGRYDMTKLAVSCLKKVGLYDEIEDRLDKNALKLSGGQQQRLCIARALMLNPDIILLDEPCSALDPISTFAVEELLGRLKQDHTLIIVTHNMEQAKRVSDYTAFFYQGKIVEASDTITLFSDPKEKLTDMYIRGVM